MSKVEQEFFVDEVYKRAIEIIELEHSTGAYDTDFATIIEVKGRLTQITIKTKNVTEQEADAIENGYKVAKEVMEETLPDNVTNILDVDDNDKLKHE